MSDELTLDPPGSIAVVGAGPLGIEAALYGRFMGYDVTLLEAEAIASRLCDHRDQPLPIPPDRCLSPLAVNALQAQFPELADRGMPTTIDAWIDDYLQRLVETDLLRGRLKCPAHVSEISLVELSETHDYAQDLDEQDSDEQDSDEQDSDEQDSDEPKDDDGSIEDIPPDFRLSFGPIDSVETLDAEAVILAVGNTSDISTQFESSTPYLFRVGESRSDNAEQDYWSGLKEIVAIYASLAGRADLDLYRPRRH